MKLFLIYFAESIATQRATPVFHKPKQFLKIITKQK